MLLLVAALTLTAAPPPPPDRPRVLVMDLTPRGVDAEVARLATGVISSVAAEDARFSVATMEDLRTMVKLEGNREAMGCNLESCLADIAASMGSRYVIYGDIGQLGASLIVNLNLYDATSAASVARRSLRAPSAEVLPDVLAPGVRELVRALQPDRPTPGLAWAGGAMLGTGALLGVGGGVGAAIASSVVATPDELPATKESALVAGQWLLGATVAGALVAVLGGALLGTALVGGGAE